MREWQVQEAKNKLSEVLRCAETDGPQYITKHGKRAAVLVSVEQYQQLSGRETKADLKALLLGGPKIEGFDIPPSDLRLRDVEF